MFENRRDSEVKIQARRVSRGIQFRFLPVIIISVLIVQLARQDIAFPIALIPIPVMSRLSGKIRQSWAFAKQFN